MRSIRNPLGHIDTRLTMTNSLMDDDIHSPSFASEIAFYDMQPNDEGTEETDLLIDPREILPQRSGKRYPRLELDAGMDKYHTLDGFTEPLNPQNTPASHTHSGSGSPLGTCRRIKTDGLRTTSAPHAFYIDWRPPGSSLNLLESDELLSCQPRRCSADDEPRSTTPISRIKMSDKVVDPHPKRPLVDIISSTRCVRFTPPLSPSSNSPDPITHPLPSIEKDRDRIATFRQRKQFAKWRAATRAKNQRASTYRSPKKSAQPSSSRLNTQPEICFSSSKLPLHEVTDSREYTRLQEDIGAYIHANENKSATQLFNLVAVSLSLYRVRKSTKRTDSGLRATNLQLSYSLRPIGHQIQDDEARNLMSYATMNDLLLYTCFIVPEFALRVPLAIFHSLNRFAHTRTGLAVLFVLRFFWSIAIELIAPVLLKLGMDAILLPELGAKY